MPGQVLIVGAGPTGLTAALELSRLGIPVRIIDKLAEPADHLARDRRPGAHAGAAAAARPGGGAGAARQSAPPAPASMAAASAIFRLDFSRIDSRFNSLLLVSQAETERVLREAVEPQGVTIERGVELVGLAQDALSHDACPVKAVLRHPDGRLEAGAGAVADQRRGRAQLVRTTLDLQFEGKTLRRALRARRPASRWRPGGDRPPHLLLRARLHGHVSRWAAGTSG